MRSVTLPWSGGARTGWPLPWPELDEKVTLRSGELLLIVADPSLGKTALATSLAIRSGWPSLYISGDSPMSAFGRLVAAACEVTVRQALNQPQIVRKEFERVVHVPHAVTLDELAGRAEAYGIWWGRAPVIFVDNLIDLIIPSQASSELTFYSIAFQTLKQIAVRLDTLIVVLHHTRKPQFGQTAQGLGDLLFGGQREARHVWHLPTIRARQDGERPMRIAILKQQDGVADPNGGYYVDLRWQRPANRIASYNEEALKMVEYEQEME